MGGMFKKPKTPKVDTSALEAAEEQRRKAQEDAALSEAKKTAAEEANIKRKKNVAASGRASTVLAGESSTNTLLGS